MFADDLRRDFYLKIKGKRVLIIVNYDVDAICACKILQSLFKTDYTLYTIVPVDLYSDLKASYKENHLDEKYIIFINCGGTIDLVEELEPDEDVTFFVLDSHRPIDVCNVYSTNQVVLLSKLDTAESIPSFNDIFRDDSEDEEGNSDGEDRSEGDGHSEEETQQSKRRRLNEEAIIKRRERRVWEEKRDKLMFDYMQYGYYGRSSALTIYELSWKLSKDSFDLLWYGIVGMHEQLLMCKVDEETYITECGDVQSHVARLTHRSSQVVDDGRNTAVRIEFDKDLRLAVFRHWTVKDSLQYSVLPATKLKFWSREGTNLKGLLAELEIPDKQARQKFASMDLLFRKEFHETVLKWSEKNNLEGMVYVSFLMQHGFRGKYAASDFVYALLAILQSTTKEKSKADCFLECLEALSRTKKEKLDEGIELSKKILMLVFRQVQSALEMKLIQSAGPFLYLILQEESADSTLCRHPYGIFLLAEFALKAYVESVSSKVKKRVFTQPLVLSTPCKTSKEAANDEEKEEALCHITAIAPLAEESNKNFFGRAFEKAAQNSHSTIIDTYFDSSVILLSVKDRSKFLDALAVLLS